LQHKIIERATKTTAIRKISYLPSSKLGNERDPFTGQLNRSALNPFFAEQAAREPGTIPPVSLE